MSKLIKLVIFHQDKQQFALHLASVERVIHSVEIMPLTMAPPPVVGTINLRGEFLPVISIRALFKLPIPEVELNDHFIVVQSPTIRMVLWVDSVDEIATISEDQIEKSGNVMVNSDFVEGFFKLRSGIVMINDLDKFLTSKQISRITADLANYHSATT